jgi:hypothetical protein
MTDRILRAPKIVGKIDLSTIPDNRPPRGVTSKRKRTKKRLKKQKAYETSAMSAMLSALLFFGVFVG